MRGLTCIRLGGAYILLFLFAPLLCKAQFPNPYELNTAASGVSAAFPIGEFDPNWLSAEGTPAGPTSPFVPSKVVGNCDVVWYNSPFLNSNWIAHDFGNGCNHQSEGCVDVFFQRRIFLPATNICNLPIGDGYCLAMDFYADNCVYAITVNDVLNYEYAGSEDPYTYNGHEQVTTVNLCSGWQAGLNTIVVHIKSCPTVEGFLAQANVSVENAYFFPFAEEKNICQGEDYLGYTASGTYVDTIQTTAGCDSIRTIHLNVLQTASTSQRIAICAGESYEGYSSSGTYTDVFPAANGCDSVRTLHLTVNSVYKSSESKTICSGSSFDFNGRLIADAGLYSDTLTSVSGCDSILLLEVRVALEDFLGNDTTLCHTAEYVIYSPFSNTVWFDGDMARFKEVVEDGLYWATTTDENGCEMTDSVYVQFHDKAYLPNVFSPNNDGINDCFRPFFSSEDDILNYHFRVFDRWGSPVFSTSNSHDCWDGENNGTKCNVGSYVYFLDLTTQGCGRTLTKGGVSLIR